MQCISNVPHDLINPNPGISNIMFSYRNVLDTILMSDDVKYETIVAFLNEISKKEKFHYIIVCSCITDFSSRENPINVFNLVARNPNKRFQFVGIVVSGNIEEFHMKTPILARKFNCKFLIDDKQHPSCQEGFVCSQYSKPVLTENEITECETLTDKYSKLEWIRRSILDDSITAEEIITDMEKLGHAIDVDKKLLNNYEGSPEDNIYTIFH